MVDWEGLKAKNFEPLIRALNIQIQIDEDGTDVGVSREAVHFACVHLSQFPAILAAHERDQRVILAAEKLREDILTINRDAWQGEGAICRSIARQSDAALAEFDKAKL